MRMRGDFLVHNFLNIYNELYENFLHFFAFTPM
jgi:hypothetical protein